MEELPPNTYGYMRKDEFYTGSLAGNLLNEWVPYALRGMLYRENWKAHVGRYFYLPDTMGKCREDLRL